MLKEEYTDGASLWILRAQNYLSDKLHSRLLASILMIYIPVMMSGLFLQLIFHYEVFTRGIFIALVWLALGPFLIQNAFRVINTFFRSHKHIFLNKNEWKDLYFQEIRRIQSPRYMMFGIPWALAVTTVILCSTYKDAPLPIKLWASTTFFVMFFVGSIGFYVIYLLLQMIKKMLDSDIVFNPYHPDRFGGIADFGRFSVKIAFYFSSGALVIPLPIEIVSMGTEYNYLNVSVYVLVSMFLITMFAMFLVPIFQVKTFVDSHKEKDILQARHELDNLIGEFRKCEELNMKKGIEIAMHYYFTYSKLLEIRNYPFDSRVLLEFAFSFIIPIGVAILQIFFV
jgi:hypothetical protein